MTTSSPYRVLYLRSGDPSDDPGDLVVRLGAEGAACHVVSIPYGRRWARLARALWQTRTIRRYDAVISHEYNLAFIASLRAMVQGLPIRNLAVSFNLSFRPLRLGFGLVDRFINRVFGRLDRIIVHSRSEIDLFVDLHRLDPARFRFSPWGFDAPLAEPETPVFNHASPPYFCMIGRNNRDFTTFAAALEQSGQRGVIICSGKQSLSLPATADIAVYRDLGMDDCAACVRHSLANVILVNDADRGAGHITAVMGMLYQRPHIFSDVSTLQDYLVDGAHGLGVPLHNVSAVAQAMRRLADDPALRARMGEAAATDARQEHSHAASTDRLIGYIMDVLQPDMARKASRT